MADFDDLKTRSEEVRDEPMIGGNTALRVGQLFYDIADAAEEVDGKTNFYLDSMGDELDGQPTYIGPGMVFYDSDNGVISKCISPGVYESTACLETLVYVNKVTNKLYRWSRAGQNMIQIAGSGDVDISSLISNDWADSSRSHVASARQMNLVYNNLLSVYNDLSALVDALANSAFLSARPVLNDLDWVGDSTSYNIVYNLTHCTKTQASPTSVAEGDSFTAAIVPSPGYTLNGVVATGTGFTQSYDSVNDRINISASNVMNGITIGCAATTFTVDVEYHLTGFSVESDTQITSAGSFAKVLTPNAGYVVRSITVLMGGVDITATAWNASTRTVSIALVTGDISITALAEESTAHQITYGLTGIVVPATTQVEDGDPLSLTLQKDTGYSGWALLRPMKACDIIVYMGGNVLEQGTDYTISQSADDADITLNIAAVTGALEIMNVVWKHHYIFYRDYPQQGTVTDPAGSAGGTAERSAYTDNYIPLPSTCMQLAVMGANDAITDQYCWGCAVYDAGKVYINGAYLNNSEVAVSLLENGVRNNAKYIRTSAWLAVNNNTSTEQYAYKIDLCYIYDVTHDKFIWCGEDVDKNAVRANH